MPKSIISRFVCVSIVISFMGFKGMGQATGEFRLHEFPRQTISDIEFVNDSLYILLRPFSLNDSLLADRSSKLLATDLHSLRFGQYKIKAELSFGSASTWAHSLAHLGEGWIIGGESFNEQLVNSVFIQPYDQSFSPLQESSWLSTAFSCFYYDPV